MLHNFETCNKFNEDRLHGQFLKHSIISALKLMVKEIINIQIYSSASYILP